MRLGSFLRPSHLRPRQELAFAAGTVPRRRREPAAAVGTMMCCWREPAAIAAGIPSRRGPRPSPRAGWRRKRTFGGETPPRPISFSI